MSTTSSTSGGTSSISGLASGLDTATIINQLMSLEAAPQTRLKTQVASDQSMISTLQALNTKVALLGSKADALAKPAASLPLTASSSNAAVTVATTTAATPVNLTVTVTGVARTHQVGFTDAAALTDAVTGSSTTVRIDRFDGSPVDLDTGDGTLGGLVNAINAPANNTGLHASALRTADGSYRLLVESTATGASQDFQITAADGSALLGGSTVRAGTDASIDLGAGVTVTSSTNTFSDLLPGVSLTLSPQTAVGTVAAVSVSRDSASIGATVKALVDAVNGVLSDIDTGSAYNSTSNTGGPYTGDPTIRSLRDSLLDAVYPPGGGTLASLGIQVTKDGLLSFDATTFAQAYAADPSGVADKISGTGGFAASVGKVTKTASDSVDGTITSAITGRNTEINQLQASIADWDLRLALRRNTLQQQFTNLETSLNQMTSQQSWLTGQIAQLPSKNS